MIFLGFFLFACNLKFTWLPKGKIYVGQYDDDGDNMKVYRHGT